ncbi:hypothetical protein K7432_007238 [Basidiobolus ranarum]|uniref:Uncharacterized protein n=1 Tax=Basidiobolus ranarum TaxID=34480 RepID=A0ABR2W0E4_9FUNG
MFSSKHTHNFPQLECDGHEAWAGEYIYPNGWTAIGSKRVVAKIADPHWNLQRDPYMKNAITLFAIVFTILFVNTFVL